MSDIGSAPPPPPPGGGAVATPAQIQQVLPNPPAAVARLPIGVKVDAQVVRSPFSATGDDVETRVALTTPSGSSTVTMPLALPRDAKLIFQVVGQQPGATTLALTTINGQVVEAGTTTPTNPGAGSVSNMGAPTANTISTGMTAASEPAPPQPGDRIIASFLRPAIAGPATQSTSPRMPGTPGPAALWPTLSSERATPLESQSVSTPTPRQATPGMPPRPQPQTTGQTVLPSGTQVGLKVVSIVAPPPRGGTSFPLPNLSSPLPSLQPGNTIAAVVTGTTTRGAPIAQIHGGVIALNGFGSLPQGAQIGFEVIEDPRVPSGLQPEGFQKAFQLGAREELLHWKTWPTIAEAARILAQASPEQAARLARRIPRPDSKLAANLLMFLGVLKTGEFKGWIGERSLRVIQRNKPKIADRLAEDFRLAAQVSNEPRGDWRIHVIPFFNGQNIDKIRMLTRHRPEEKENDGIDKERRFILDLDLSNLGRMQLDGLVKAGGKRVDLIVRTDKPLPKTMRTDIQDIHAEAGKITGMTGAVTFQAAPANFVEFPPPSNPPAKTGGVLV